MLHGWLLLFAGVFELVVGLSAKKWSGVFFHLLGGVLSIVVGALVTIHPDAGALALTLLLATLFLAGGLTLRRDSSLGKPSLLRRSPTDHEGGITWPRRLRINSSIPWWPAA